MSGIWGDSPTVNGRGRTGCLKGHLSSVSKECQAFVRYPFPQRWVLYVRVSQGGSTVAFMARTKSCDTQFLMGCPEEGVWDGFLSRLDLASLEGFRALPKCPLGPMS